MELTSAPISFIDSSHIRELVHDKNLTETEKLKEMSRQFEGIFLRQFLNEALRPMVKGYLDESGSSNDIYRYFMTEVLADSMSQRGSIGFSNILQTQLQGALSPAETNNNE